MGPTLPISDWTHATKYRLEGETFESAMRRVANALKDDQPHFNATLDIMMDMRFMPAGRVQAAMGAPKVVTPYNCLSGETEILTREFGAIRISEVANRTVTLLDGLGNWVPCFVYDHGVQTTYVMTFKGGFSSVEIRSTLEHGWVHGDTVVRTKAFIHVGGKREIDGLSPQKTILDEDVYRRGVEHGIIYGDGSEQDGHYKLRLCGAKVELLSFLRPDNITTPSSSNGDTVCLYHKTKKHINFKSLPDCTDLDYLRGFLRGWFATDGCVSEQSEATLCCGPEEETWLKQWSPLIGWQPANSTVLNVVTNKGIRKKASRNLHFRRAWMVAEDFLRQHHRARWTSVNKGGTDWRVHGRYHTPRDERVYCPVVPTTHSFALACGIHSQNCFVSGTIDDSFTDGTGSIMARATEAAQTMRLGGGIGYDFCLAPGTKITMSDGSFKNVEDIKDGDSVIGFSENFSLQKTLFEEAVVESNQSLTQPCYEIVTDKGTITASARHLFVARTKNTPKKYGEGMRWIAVENLAPGNLIGFTAAPWDTPEEKADSWLAGMFDGEGWATATNVGIAQNAGEVADRIRAELNKMGVSFREHVSNKLVSFVARGKWEAFKIVAILRPTRLSWTVLGKKLCGKSSKPARVLEIKYIGDRTVWATRTSTRTLIANGFLSHNSTLRPRGDIIRKLGSQSSGPISFMHIYDAVCKCVASSGHRRGAQMGVLRVDHPDIVEFINAKKNATDLTGFNISVAITDEFMECLTKGKPFMLRFGGNNYREIDPAELWDAIMKNTWDWAEPGVLFIDQINRMNNLRYCETIAATNPSMPAGTMVHCDKGVVPIESLEGTSFNVKSMDGVWAPAKCFLSSPAAEVYEIDLGGGRKIRATAEHRWPVLLNGRYVKVYTRDLVSGDAIPLNRNEPMGHCVRNDLTRADGFAAGYIFGNGAYGVRKDDGRAYLSVSINREDADIHEWLATYLSVNKTERERELTVQVTQNSKVLEFINHVGLSLDGKKSLPETVWKSNDAFVSGFIDGLISSDGHVSESGITFVNKDKFVTEQFAILLGFLGIGVNIGRKTTRLGDKVFASYYVHVNKGGMRRFANVVSLTSTRKGALLDNFTKTPSRDHINHDHCVVRSVTRLSGKVPVWDVSVYHNQHVFPTEYCYTGNCGEQPLPPHGACLLGSFNLVKYLNKSKNIDYDQLARDIPHIVRAMDNVVDRAEYPLPQQGREARSKRRMGLGVTGLANALEAKGRLTYGSHDFVSEVSRVLEFINHHAYLASVELAKEKGAFAKFEAEHYLEGAFLKTLDKDLRRAIRKHGIRNSHLTSIAPTGTISLSADNVSSGIEPVFAYSYDRTIQTFDGPRVETVEDYGVRVFGVEGKKADKVTVEEHVAVLCGAQKHVDSAVSKTCNVGDDVTFDRFQNVYRAAWEGGAKGITTFRASGKRYGILVSKDANEPDVSEGGACHIDPDTGARSCE